MGKPEFMGIETCFHGPRASRRILCSVRSEGMASVKQPKWDKQEGPPLIIANPSGPNRNPSLVEPLKVGQQAIGTIGGVEIAVVLKDILTPTKACGEIVAIMDGMKDLDSLGDLSVGDSVLITRQDMYSLEIDTDLP